MYKNKTKFFFILLITFTFISYIFSKEIKIYEGDTFERDLKNFIQTKTKLFLIFFAKNCEYCGYSVRVLKELIVPHYENDDKISFGVINLDRKSNFWIGLKFNITHIPYIILIEDRKMYLFKEQFEENQVINFINEEKNIEDAFDIPKEITLFSKLKAAIDELSNKIEKVLGMYGINHKYGKIIAYLTIIIGISSFIYLENKLIDSCKNSCMKKKKKEPIKEGSDNNNKNDNKEKTKKD